MASQKMCEFVTGLTRHLVEGDWDVSERLTPTRHARRAGRRTHHVVQFNQTPRFKRDARGSKGRGAQLVGHAFTAENASVGFVNTIEGHLDANAAPRFSCCNSMRSTPVILLAPGLLTLSVALASGCTGSSIIGRSNITGTKDVGADLADGAPADIADATVSEAVSPDATTDDVLDATAMDAGDATDGDLDAAGDGTVTEMDTPRDFGVFEAGDPTQRAGQVSAGSFTCVVTLAGAVRCCGANDLNQIGDGTTMARNVPTATRSMGSPLTGVAQVAAGGVAACARLTTGAVQCWGANAYGQLGDGTTQNRSSAVAVMGLTGTTDLAAGTNHFCAVLADRTVSCWGRNHLGQLGDGMMAAAGRSTPAPVTGLTNVRQVELGQEFSCALLFDGTVRCWGGNTSSQIGDGTGTTRLTPTPVMNLSNVVRIAVGDVHACALLVDRTVRCWGLGTAGQLGDGTGQTRPLPVAVPNLTNVVDLAAGSSHTCAALLDGTISCWGSNLNGQIGDGSMAARPMPTAVMGVAGALQVSAGASHSCARLFDGTVRCWGNNDRGQLGDATTMQRTTAASMRL